MPKRLRLLAALLITCFSISAMGKTVVADKAKPESQAAKANSDLVSATNEYKASVQELIKIYETALKTATERLEKRKEIFAQGLISKRDLEAAALVLDPRREPSEVPH